MSQKTSRQRLEDLYQAAIVAIQPDRAVCAALDHAGDVALHANGGLLHVIAIGKAARTMLRAALAWCEAQGQAVAGGVCVSHETDDAALPSTITVTHGDHPHPGDASATAGALLRTYVASAVVPGARVLVLLSGGTSSLIGAPVHAVTHDTYRACCAALLRSGLDIHAHNALRRQLSMWGNGRLGAELHGAGAVVTVLAISDVPGDAAVSIGSAPCIASPVQTAADEALLASAVSLTDDDRVTLREALRAAESLQAAEFPAIAHHVVSSNRTAREAVAAVAGSAIRVEVSDEMLVEDAHRCGEMIARQLIAARATLAEPTLLCWGGEPVVHVPSGAPRGGRMQALALAVARTLHDAGTDAAHGITLLAAGSDGRDGDTAAAGAVVDGMTWSTIERSGRDPLQLLTSHDSHAALRDAGCLIPAFVSGTNVNDLVIALVEPVRRDEAP